MKKSILILIGCAFITGAFLTSCNTPSQKVEDAQKNVIQANKDLEQANKEYLADMDNYRLETAKQIAANEQSMTEFKARIAHDKKTVKAEYDKKIAELEQKNSDMKKRLDDYKAEGKDNWVKFKADFSHSMDELGQAFKDLTAKKAK
jgi:hypothetical protein